MPVTGIASIMAVLIGGWLYTRSSNSEAISWYRLKAFGHPQWNKGESSTSTYRTIPDNVLAITAGPGTDHNKKNRYLKQSPRMAVPMFCSQNFEANVKVRFLSAINFQRAIFGISDPGRKNDYIYIYLLEGYPNPRVETGINFNNSIEHHSRPENIQSDSLYLKIKNTSGNIDLLYSEDNLEWKRTEIDGLEFPIKISFPESCELYFEVLSTDLNYSAFAEFTNLYIHYF